MRTNYCLTYIIELYTEAMVNGPFSHVILKKKIASDSFIVSKFKDDVSFAV